MRNKFDVEKFNESKKLQHLEQTELYQRNLNTAFLGIIYFYGGRESSGYLRQNGFANFANLVPKKMDIFFRKTGLFD